MRIWKSIELPMGDGEGGLCCWGGKRLSLALVEDDIHLYLYTMIQKLIKKKKKKKKGLRLLISLMLGKHNQAKGHIQPF